MWLSFNAFFLATWRAGLRNRSFHAVLAFGVILVGVAYLASSFSPRQPKTVALDVGFSGIRLSLVLLGLFWVQDLVAKEIERSTILWAITYPVSRGWYLLGRYLGIVALLGVSVLVLGNLLWFAVVRSAGSYQQGFDVVAGWPYWATLGGIWLDASVVTAFALWIATLSTVPMLPLTLGLAFAISGKSLGSVADYLAQGADGDAQTMRFAPLIDAIQWLLPDLSRLDWRIWPMYGAVPEIGIVAWAIALALAYIALAFALAVFGFSRREFQ
jgi:Cu-processing system permease protein